ncbi:ring-cleaving dioxygenase [Xinfangfangia sp. D13-10-4-6]|uniref:VOC family protein n=1 Tax=Pseudogemmobacter hezensis TaxID=2737662 RepID=UPI00155227D1|nr:VOC family protein [Pseudogemmobacter hezensis]NPD13907.1 ring-cleaving dioxygenase [Pseudogemmobacter hezensis]
MTTGIHHVTGITANVQANVDFYMGFLGLSLVKQTGGYEDAEQLHLIYGNPKGDPGSLATFLVWEGAGRGRTGLGQVSEFSFAVPAASIGDWLTKALSARLKVEGPSREFGQPVLRLKDPDGMVVKLVGTDLPEDADHPTAAPTRLQAVTLLTADADGTAAFVTRFGYHEIAREGATIRLQSDTDVVDILGVSGFVPSIPGAGVADHVAFRAADADALREMRLSLKDHGPTHVHDRKYFLSLYVREPGGSLIEYATDGPGMGVDEAADQLGRILFVPEGDAARADDLRIMLPQFARPGEERFPMRDLPFIHRFHRPEDPDGSTIILLHGTGGNETDLMPLAHKIAPRAVLLGVRGRSTEEGINRWFRRFDATTYDQADVRAEAEAFAGFVEGAVGGYGIDPARLSFLGYSNGANLLGAVMQLQPGLVQRAILLRAVQALNEAPSATPAPANVLMLNGARDPFASMAPPLEAALRAAGAGVSTETLSAGHELAAEDLGLAKAWLES